MKILAPYVVAYHLLARVVLVGSDLFSREVLKVGDLAVKKSWSDQNLSEFSKVNLIGQI